MILKNLQKHGVIHPPKWLIDNSQYLTIMGSEAYGVSSNASDQDIYGFAIAPKELTFPHLAGVIEGFGDQGQRFEQWQEHHIKHPNKDIEYDFSIYNIVKYFQLCMENNPNMIDSLFTPRRCIIHSTAIGELVRENRKKFLHKGAFYKFKGYAYAQMGKIRGKTNYTNEKRAADIEKYGYSTKYAYHLVRLLSECEQILVEGNLDLERNREQLKDIRRGEWTIEQLEKHFTEKEAALETLYANSSLPASPNEKVLKELLMNCLEMHYGSLNTVVSKSPAMEVLLGEMRELLNKYE